MSLCALQEALAYCAGLRAEGWRDAGEVQDTRSIDHCKIDGARVDQGAGRVSAIIVHLDAKRFGCLFGVEDAEAIGWFGPDNVRDVYAMTAQLGGNESAGWISWQG